MDNQEINARIGRWINFIRAEKIFSFKESLQIATRADYIINNMLTGNTQFSYITRSGKRKDVCGTLTLYKNHFGKLYAIEKAGPFVPYYDVDKKQWFVFHLSSVII